jgi:hypothetical protein
MNDCAHENRSKNRIDCFAEPFLSTYHAKSQMRVEVLPTDRIVVPILFRPKYADGRNR